MDTVCSYNRKHTCKFGGFTIKKKLQLSDKTAGFIFCTSSETNTVILTLPSFSLFASGERLTLLSFCLGVFFLFFCLHNTLFCCESSHLVCLINPSYSSTILPAFTVSVSTSILAWIYFPFTNLYFSSGLSELCLIFFLFLFFLKPPPFMLRC